MDDKVGKNSKTKWKEFLKKGTSALLAIPTVLRKLI
jgi:hypothetical protein